LETSLSLTKHHTWISLVLLHILLGILYHLILLLAHWKLLHLLLLLIVGNLLLHLSLFLRSRLLLLLSLRLGHECLLHLLIVLDHVGLSLLLVCLMEVLLFLKVLVDLRQVQRDVLCLTTAVSIDSLDVVLMLLVSGGRWLRRGLSHWCLCDNLWKWFHLGGLFSFRLFLVKRIWDRGCLPSVVLTITAILRCAVLIIIASSASLLLVLLENSETIWQLENWLLHLKIEDALVLAIH